MEQKYEAEKIEAQRRFDALPENLKKEIQADKNVELIHSVCQDYSLPEEKVKYLTFLVGEVFLGYIKPEEVAYQLNNFFDIDLQKSNFIEIELKQKLFNALKADLDKIYNPLPAEALAKEGAVKEEEVSPTVIKLESEAKPISNVSTIPLQKPSQIITEKKPEAKFSPLTMGSVIPGLTRNPESLDSRLRGNDKEPVELAAPTAEPAPFIIQTKVEAVKPAIPQFPKETPSLNLKVDPSIIQRAPIIKPISVHLETAQPIQEKKFQMPVIAGQKIFGGAPAEKVPEKQSGAIESLRVPPKQSEFSKIAASQTPRNDGKVLPTISQATQPKIEIKPPQPLSSPSLKEISEQKTTSPLIERKITAPEPAKVVHYSNFKTNLTNLGTPKQPTTNNSRSTTKEGFINLNTFTKVSGNTVDLRKSNN
ncbi:MAG: hypothetical protein AAB626_00210 [Patescibacteria group bacterium]